MVVAALLLKDARLLVRDRPLLAALLAYPLLLAGVLGAAFQEPPATLDLAVVDLDRSGATLDVGGTPVGVAELLDAAAPFAALHRVSDVEEARRLVRSGDVDAALVVPASFIADLSRLGGSAALQLIVDESDPIRAGVARHAIEGAVERFVERIVQKKIDDVVALLALTVDGGEFVNVRVLGIEGALARLEEVNATLPPGGDASRKIAEVSGFLAFARQLLGNSEQFLTTTALPVELKAEGLSRERASLASVALPGALVLGVFWTGALASATLVAREREAGTNRRLAAAPRVRARAIASKLGIALTAGLAPAAVVLGLGIGLLDARVASVGLALVVLAGAALAAAAFGALAAAIARGAAGASLLVVLALVPMLLLGGLFYPVAYMPDAAQAVSGVLPLTLATDALRGAMIRGSALSELAPALAGLAASAFLAAGGVWLLGRRAP